MFDDLPSRFRPTNGWLTLQYTIYLQYLHFASIIGRDVPIASHCLPQVFPTCSYSRYRRIDCFDIQSWCRQMRQCADSLTHACMSCILVVESRGLPTAVFF